MPFTPDKSGSFPTFDPDIANFDPTEWNTGIPAGAQGAVSARNPHFRTAVVREDFDQLTYSSSAATVLQAGSSITIGAAVQPNANNYNLASPLSMIYQADICVSASYTTGSGIYAECGFGKLDQPTVSVDYTAVGNKISEWKALNQVILGDSSGASARWNGALIPVDHGRDGFVQNPYVAFGTIGNVAAGNGTFVYFTVSITVQRYVGEIGIFDAVR